MHTATVADNGTWRVPFTATEIPADADRSAILAKLTDGLQNESLIARTEVAIRTALPAAPSLALAADTGDSASDGATKNGQVLVSGLVAATVWQYSTDGGDTWINGRGSSFSLVDDSYSAGQIRVRQTDPAGNPSAEGSIGMPLVIQSRDADADMAAILADEMGQGAFKAVLHCFSSGAGLAAAGLELGLFVSFSGILTFRRSDELRAIAATVPLDRLLVETDAPYLAPQAWRGKRNEPAYLAATCATLAEVHGMSADAMAEQTTRNFFRLFSKAEAPAGAVAA